MTSILSEIKQVDAPGGYYYILGDLRGLETANVPVAGATGGAIPTGGTGVLLSYVASANKMSTCAWAAAPLNATNGGRFSSLVAAAGRALLKDMGKTVVSSSRTFRKVQLVVPTAGGNSTFGVAGDSGTTNGNDYLTAYIELNVDGYGVFTPVAKFGR